MKKKEIAKKLPEDFFSAGFFVSPKHNRQKFIDFYKIFFNAYLKIYRIKNRSKLKK